MEHRIHFKREAKLWTHKAISVLIDFKKSFHNNTICSIDKWMNDRPFDWWYKSCNKPSWWPHQTYYHWILNKLKFNLVFIFYDSWSLSLALFLLSSFFFVCLFVSVALDLSAWQQKPKQNNSFSVASLFIYFYSARWNDGQRSNVTHKYSVWSNRLAYLHTICALIVWTWTLLLHSNQLCVFSVSLAPHKQTHKCKVQVNPAIKSLIPRMQSKQSTALFPSSVSTRSRWSSKWTNMSIYNNWTTIRKNNTDEMEKSIVQIHSI